MLGIVAIVVGMALVAITLIALPGIATTTTVETTVTTSRSSSLEHEVLVGGVGITLGRAVLHPNERVTLFYVARNTAEELDGAVMIDNAEVERSDGRSWLADGHGVVLERPPLTLGWLTFPVSDAAPGRFKVTAKSVQANGDYVTGLWHLPRLAGLESRRDMLESLVIDSDLCVSSGSVAFGFHDKACAVEFVDPHSLRQSGGTPETTGVTPRPTPTPTHTSTQPTPIRPPQVTKPLAMEDPLVFSLCTPWHFRVVVELDDTGIPGRGSRSSLNRYPLRAPLAKIRIATARERFPGLKRTIKYGLVRRCQEVAAVGAGDLRGELRFHRGTFPCSDASYSL